MMRLSLRRFLSPVPIAGLPILLFLAGMASCPPRRPPPPDPQLSGELAIGTSWNLEIIDLGLFDPLATDPETRGRVEVERYAEVHEVAFRPDASRLAVAVCAGDRVGELDPDSAPERYAEVPDGQWLTADSCPWDLAYSPDGEWLAATLPMRSAGPFSQMSARLVVTRLDPEAERLERTDLGSSLPAIAYRPDGEELAVATGRGIRILGAAEGLQNLRARPPSWSTFKVLEYTKDGSWLLAGTDAGWLALSPAAGYEVFHEDRTGEVRDIAVDPTGSWIAIVRAEGLRIVRSPDFSPDWEIELKRDEGGGRWPEDIGWLEPEDRLERAAFSPDGGLLALSTEPRDRVLLLVRRRGRDGRTVWRPHDKLGVIETNGRVMGLAFRPSGTRRLPVLFVHGHGGDAVSAWFERSAEQQEVVEVGERIHLADVLSLNAGEVPVDAFFLTFPKGRPLEVDAQDIRAAIEGGPDSHGASRVGILQMPAYRGGRVAIVAYSKGSMSGRYYVAKLMGGGPGGAATVSTLVLLASPSHGLGGLGCGSEDEPPDAGLRQLCAGRESARGLSACRSCLGTPAYFEEGQQEEAFLLDLIGRCPLGEECEWGLEQTCGAGPDPVETPRGDEVAYVSIYVEGRKDLLAGGDPEGADCLGRRVARILSPQAENRALNAPYPYHAGFVYRWETLCMALRTAMDGTAPKPDVPGWCDLVRPQPDRR